MRDSAIKRLQSEVKDGRMVEDEALDFLSLFDEEAEEHSDEYAYDNLIQSLEDIK